MKLRNVKVAKRLGTKTLAGLLAFGLIVGTPSVVLADGGAETAGTQSTASQTPAAQAEKLQAKSVDGKDTLTDVSDAVKEMIQRGEVKLDEEYRISDRYNNRTESTNPVTGERVDQIPADTGDTGRHRIQPDTPSTPAYTSDTSRAGYSRRNPEAPADAEYSRHTPSDTE